ncbi:MAG: NIF family HAD-type phosphatase [Syntrophomonadaceae bacterium]
MKGGIKTIVVFDMDNTLVDELGSKVRPGMLDLLTRLNEDGHTLILWTSSKRQRAQTILHFHRLDSFFTNFVYREDYDPKEEWVRKDIRMVNGDVLIDDDPNEIDFTIGINKAGFLISAFRQGKNPPLEELEEIYRFIRKKSGFFGKLWGSFRK